MAWTDYYVTASGNAPWASATSPGSPCSLATAFANATAGDRVNVEKGGYTLAANLVQSNGGTAARPIWFRGYNAAIGDLNGTRQGTDQSGGLDVANYPTLTMGAFFIQPTSLVASYLVLDCMNLEGTRNGSLILNANADQVTLRGVRIFNDSTGTGCKCVSLDNNCNLFNCDFHVAGSNSTNVAVDCDINPTVSRCRFHCNSGRGFEGLGAVVADCTFIGNGSSAGMDCVSASYTYDVNGCTFVGWYAGIQTPNNVYNQPLVVANCMITDNTYGIYNPYQATADHAVFAIGCRFRDNSAADLSGFGDTADLQSGSITTDTGDETSDYVGAGGLPFDGDYRIKTTSPAFEAGSFPPKNPGPYQSEDQGGGGGGGGPRAFGF